MTLAISKFLKTLQTPRKPGVFNPWYRYSAKTDISPNAPQIRLKHLKTYIQERRQAEVLLVAEALGYQGGRFTGIPMTSERLLLYKHTVTGFDASDVISSIIPKRTSRVDLKPTGFTEPTASIVWGSLIAAGIDTRRIIFWNAFPWHPYDTGKGLLSNRPPTAKEYLQGQEALRQLITLIQPRQIIALGNGAQTQLEKLEFDAPKVRHPARGGATEFRQQISEYLV